MQDPAYLLRLHEKTASLLTTTNKDGSKAMSTAFESVDGRYKSHGGAVDANTLLTVARPIFPVHAMTDRELRVLLHMLPLTDDDGTPSVEDTGADPVQLLSALRRLVPIAAWQLWYIVSRVRTAVFKSETTSGLELHLRDVLAGHPVEPVTVKEALHFLIHGGGGRTASEAELVVEYCQPASGARGCLDAPLLHGLLFAQSVPSTVEYPILAARFAEATAESSPKLGCSATGSLALLEALHGALSLPGAANARPPEVVAQELDIDFPDAVMNARLTGRQFHDVCRRLGTQFAQEQSDQLYYYLTNEPGALSARSVVQMYRQYFPAVSSSHFQVVLGATQRTIAKSGDHLAFYALYKRLEEWGSGPIPLAAFVEAVRAAGVAQTVVPDLAVEWLRLKASTRVDLILLLCMPVPPSREAVIRKLYERLDTQQRGFVGANEVMAQFTPDKIEGDQVRKNAVRWKAALQSYLEEIEEERLTYELFAFFWYMLSAAVEDDPTYTMVVWQGFSLAERRATRR